VTIPVIKSYPLPKASELPENKVNWTIDPNKAVLLIHDMQQYFVNFYGEEQAIQTKIIDNIVAIKAAAIDAGIPVFYTAQPGQQSAEERGLLNDMWGPGLNKSPSQQKVVDQLAPTDNDTVLTKWRYSAFQKSPLEHTMNELGKDQLIICGIYAHIGCMITATDAFMRDIKAFMVADAVADFSAEEHMMALNYLAKRCGSVITKDSLIKSISTKANVQWTHQQLLVRIAGFIQLPIEDIDCDESLIDYGLDSIRVMNLVEEWRTQNIEISFQQLAENPTINNWWKLLQSSQEK